MLDARPRSPLRPLFVRLHACSAACYAFALLVSGCGGETALEATQKEAFPPEATGLSAGVRRSDALAKDPEENPSSVEDDGLCGGGMALVAGDYCLTPEQRCIGYQDIPGEGGKIIPNQCLRFAEPVICFQNRRRPMRFCMDRYEWPNKKGELPRTLVSWHDARALSETAGKRLSTEEALCLRVRAGRIKMQF
jgi:hypothetical protein